MKTQEQRIRDAAAECGRLAETISFKSEYTIEEVCERILAAADREIPVWPSDLSVYASYEGTPPTFIQPGHPAFETRRNLLRAALDCDPIHTAAVALVKEWKGQGSGPLIDRLLKAQGVLARAIKEARL